MTIQVLTGNQSKTILQACLTDKPESVRFYDPAIIPSKKGERFSGVDIPHGDHFEVVLDHPARRRFAKIQRKADGSFKVM